MRQDRCVSRLSGVLTDVRPLRASPAYRRLWIGQTVSAFGQQMTIVAIAFEVYSLTRSSFSVGLIGLAALIDPRERWARLKLLIGANLAVLVLSGAWIVQILTASDDHPGLTALGL